MYYDLNHMKSAELSESPLLGLQAENLTRQVLDQYVMHK